MDFFILANPRSGSTLLRLMLNNHSLIGVPPESGFLHWWYDKYKDWNVADNENIPKLELFLNDILSSKKIEGWDLNKDDLKRTIIQQNPKKYIELIDEIYRFYCHNKPIIGDKNNYYINYLEDIAKIAPEAKFIHLVRDGRDVACSYKSIKELNPKLKYLPKVTSSIKEIAKEWSQNVLKIEHFTSNKNAITIRYEDLITESNDTLEKICQFLNVNFETEMLSYYKSENNDEPSSTILWKSKTLQSIDKSNKNKYKQLLSDKEIKDFNAIALVSLKKFQYE